MSETILKVEDLKTSFMTSSGEVQAVRGVSFEVHKGEILGIVGESGSGKSVTSMSILRLLADTARIKNGKIEFEGTDLTKVSDKQMREIRGQKIAMVFQDPMSSLNPLIPVGKQVAEMIHVHHPEMKRDELQAATLELFREVRIPDLCFSVILKIAQQHRFVNRLFVEKRLNSDGKDAIIYPVIVCALHKTEQT